MYQKSICGFIHMLQYNQRSRVMFNLGHPVLLR